MKRVKKEQGKFGVEGRHDLRREFRKRHLEPAVREVFRHLHADEAAARDEHFFGASFFQIAVYRERIVNVAQGEDALARKPEGLGRSARRQDEFIVTLPVFPFGGAHGDGVRIAVDGNHFRSDAHVDAEAVLKERGRGDGERALLLDDPAQIVRKPAVRIRDIFAALKEHDLRLFRKSSQPCRTARTARNAADDDNFHNFLPKNRLYNMIAHQRRAVKMCREIHFISPVSKRMRASSLASGGGESRSRG